MSNNNIFWKNFILCFSNSKLQPSNHQSLITNFNSLYTSSTTTTTSSSDHRRSSVDSTPPDFATVFASNRFFFSSPGSSNSILEPLDSPSPPVSGSVAVEKFSPDPYSDFRRSMQEMVESRNLTDLSKDWEFLHELLLCYLMLNPKNTHKYIFTAFSDLVVSLNISFQGCRNIEDELNRTQ